MKKKIGIALLFVFIIMQFFRPERNLGTNFGEENIREAFTPNVPDSVLAVLQMACFDCHSDHTVYPWYTNVQPVGWWMAKHVRNGKKRLNFDEWKHYPTDKARKKLDGIVEVLEEDEMPLKSYRLIHTNAKLSEAQKQTVITWAKEAQSKL